MNEEMIVYLEAELEYQPKAASVGSVGYDLKSRIDLVIEPGETILVPTGIKMALPQNVEAQIRPRSGLSLRTSLRIPNAPGTIDSDYRDELCIISTNVNSLFLDGSILLKDPELASRLNDDYEKIQFSKYYNHKTKKNLPLAFIDQTIYLDRAGHPLGSIYISKGERIAQLVFAQIIRPKFIRVETVADIGQNRGGGFGSSGC